LGREKLLYGTKQCSKCGKDTTFMREDLKTQPSEGEVCTECGEWFCVDCIDWKKSNPDPVCKECATETVKED